MEVSFLRPRSSRLRPARTAARCHLTSLSLNPSTAEAAHHHHKITRNYPHSVPLLPTRLLYRLPSPDPSRATLSGRMVTILSCKIIQDDCRAYQCPAIKATHFTRSPRPRECSVRLTLPQTRPEKAATSRLEQASPQRLLKRARPDRKVPSNRRTSSHSSLKQSELHVVRLSYTT